MDDVTVTALTWVHNTTERRIKEQCIILQLGLLQPTNMNILKIYYLQCQDMNFLLFSLKLSFVFQARFPANFCTFFLPRALAPLRILQPRIFSIAPFFCLQMPGITSSHLIKVYDRKFVQSKVVFHTHKFDSLFHRITLCVISYPRAYTARTKRKDLRF